jgi:Caspase domain
MRKALLVGIDDYPNAPLSGCVADAELMRQVLSKNEDGSPNFDCRVITAPHARVERPHLRQAIEQLFGDEADVALLHFSGHGAVSNLGGYLVTQDVKRYDEGVPMADVLTFANNRRVKEVVIFLDCCHSGALGQVPSVDNDKAVLREGVSILTASRDSQVAVERGGHGLVTTMVSDALLGGAADVCGSVSVASVYAYVDQRLGGWDQRPMFKSNLSKLIPIRKCKPQVPLENLRGLPRLFKSPEYEFPLDPSYEPTAEPRHAEKERIFSQLQQLRAARLLVPVGEEHLYFAAINSKGCALTPLGQHYWHLAKAGRI